MNKIVTMCGSMKFKKEMINIAEKLELENNYVVIQCIYGEEGKNLTSDELAVITRLHCKKIDISDAIYVVNVGGYIGQSVKNEIEYALSKGKEVLYLENVR